MPAGWTATISGVGRVLATLETVEFQYTSNRVYVVGTNVEYAPYVEFGTSKMDAQPFLFRAAREVEREVGKYFNRAPTVGAGLLEIAKAIERLAKKYCPVDTGNLRSSIAYERVR